MGGTLLRAGVSTVGGPNCPYSAVRFQVSAVAAAYLVPNCPGVPRPTPTEVSTLLLRAQVHSGRRLLWAPRAPPSAARSTSHFPLCLALITPHFVLPHSSRTHHRCAHCRPRARLVDFFSQRLVRFQLRFSSRVSLLVLAVRSFVACFLSCVLRCFLVIFAASIRCVFPLMPCPQLYLVCSLQKKKADPPQPRIIPHRYPYTSLFLDDDGTSDPVTATHRSKSPL